VSDADLVGTLRQAGSLSAQQLDYLRQRGFLPAADRAGESEPGWDDEVSFTDADDETERYAGERRRGGKRQREANLKAKALAPQLEALYRDRLGVLSALVPLADGCDEPAGAVRWLRQRSPDELAGPLYQRLGDGSTSVERLWNVLALADFDAIDGEGSVATSYRALVRAARAGQTDLPVSYAWLLREPGVSAAYDLLVTQRLLTEAVGLVHRRDAAVLRDGLRRRPQALAFWALLILFNVDLEAGRVGKGTGQLRSVQGRPDDGTWAKAWSQALLMNESEALPLLAKLHARSRTAQGEAPLLCPASWGRLVFRYSG
jgi:hypothetical protein